MKQIKTDQKYLSFLTEIKQKIYQAQRNAHLAINKNMIMLYWDIGHTIQLKQEIEHWGSKVIKRLSSDLKSEAPQLKSFSVRNLKYMLKLYRAYPDQTFVESLLCKVPWGHNITIMQKVKDPTEREYYLWGCIENGWSRSVLVHQIESNLFERDHEKNKQHNFQDTLPINLAQQAQNAIKDQYNLEFLGLEKQIKERELESKMLERIRDVLLEFGGGFAFLGSQYKINLEEDEYFIDLLFFHRALQCLVAVELKVEEFIPEFSGKMNFYLNLLDEKERLSHENPSIGILLCKNKNRTRVDFALRGLTKPMGVSEYQLTKQLPRELKGKFPEPGQLKQTLNRELEEEPSRKPPAKSSKINSSLVKRLQKEAGKVAKGRAKKYKLWAQFRKAFDLNSYRDLTRDRLDEALRWIARWKGSS